MKWRFGYILILVSFIFADESGVDEIAKCMAGKRCEEEESGFIVIPFLFYSAETNVGVGASLLRYSKIKGLDHKPDQFLGNIILTLKKQISFIAYTDQYSIDDNHHFFSKLEFKYYPDKYFGIGPSASLDYEESFTPLFLRNENSYLYNIIDKLYIGPMAKFEYSKLVEITENAMIDSLKIPGEDGVMAISPGIKLAYDSRDDTFYPTSGMLAEAYYQYVWDIDKGDYNYSNFTLDFKDYLGLGGRHVIAYQLYSELQNGKVPFQFMPKVGGSNQLRGYYEGRYRDKNLLAGQLEYRFPLYRRFGAVAFIGAGQVSNRFDDFKIDSFKPAGGLGLRFLLIKDQNINIRADFGYSEDGIEFYITAMEAF
ncbi:MAG: BamA/TamA family outer membrane protein [Candidatus Zixiibacteriota bacterium]